MPAQKYGIGDTFVSMLSPEHLPLLSSFSSDNQELNYFLQHDALGFQHLHIGVTYLLFRKSDNKLLAYTTLSMGALKLPEKKEEFVFVGKKLGEYPKDFPIQMPALLIGKLATDKSEEGKGAASLLLDHAATVAFGLRNAVGCAFLVAHVYALPKIVSWYEKKYFKRVFQGIEGRETVPLYFELGA